MTSICYTPWKVPRVRATLLDSCGAPVTGCSTVVTDGIISVAMTKEYEVRERIRGGVRVTQENVGQSLAAEVDPAFQTDVVDRLGAHPVAAVLRRVGGTADRPAQASQQGSRQFRSQVKTTHR